MAYLLPAASDYVGLVAGGAELDQGAAPARQGHARAPRRLSGRLARDAPAAAAGAPQRLCHVRSYHWQSLGWSGHMRQVYCDAHAAAMSGRHGRSVPSLACEHPAQHCDVWRARPDARAKRPQEVLGIPKGKDAGLVPSGYPGLAYLPHTPGLVVTLGIRDPGAFPSHLLGCAPRTLPAAPHRVCLLTPGTQGQLQSAERSNCEGANAGVFSTCQSGQRPLA